MMFWYGNGADGWGWFAMSIGMVVFWAAIISVGVLLYRALARPHEHPRTHPASSPEQVLADRFARGEIDEEEYRRRLSALGARPSHQTMTAESRASLPTAGGGSPRT